MSGPRDPRLPRPGTVIVRVHGGVEHRIEVLEQGFLYQGRKWRSLSAIARDVTGTIWNGLGWAGLLRRAAPPAPPSEPAPAEPPHPTPPPRRRAGRPIVPRRSL